MCGPWKPYLIDVALAATLAIAVAVFVVPLWGTTKGDDVQCPGTGLTAAEGALNALLLPYREIVPEPVVSAVVSECSGLRLAALHRDIELWTEVYGAERDLVREANRETGVGVCIYTSELKDFSGDELSLAAKNAREAGIWPAYIDRRQNGSRLDVYAIPLGYQSSPEYWMAKIRVEVLVHFLKLKQATSPGTSKPL